MAKRYAWVITQDKISAPDFTSAVGVTGPYDPAPDLLTRVQAGEGEMFRILDDDGIHYLTGRVLARDRPANGVRGEEQKYPAVDEMYLRPLDDFGTPSYGATTIQYRNPTTKAWEAM